MAETGWPEAANRRLRNLLWQRWPIAEMALRMERPVGEIERQMKRLGLVRHGRR